jgi:hypothetical protein
MMENDGFETWKYENTLIDTSDEDTDMVNNPAHYNQQGIECIEAIAAATEQGFQYYLQGNIMKYLWRYRYKNGVEDLRKAQWYLQLLIEIYEDEN